VEGIVRSDCRACRARDLVEILDLGEMALAGGFLRAGAEVAAERRYPLRVHICRTCRLVQILQAIDPDVLFQDYSFASSTVEPLVRHFDAMPASRPLPARVVVGSAQRRDSAVLCRCAVSAAWVDLSYYRQMARASGLGFHRRVRQDARRIASA
jgi:hypothetical protein